MNNRFDLEEEVLFKNDNNSEFVNEEVLFSHSSNEELEYVEPTKHYDTGSEVLFGSRNEITEESLYHDTHVEDLSGVGSEVLFGAKVEDILVENDVHYEIAGEDLAFSEPVMPNYMNEEVLFKEVEEEEPVIDNYQDVGGIFDESLLDSVLTVAEDKKVYEDKNFTQKMLEADEIILQRYNELKNIILNYKGVKSRISNNYDTFNKGRLQLFKMCTTGKSLKLYLNLDFNEVESRLKCKFAGDKKSYEQVPVLLRIKSDRAMKNAKYLIEKVAEKYELKKVKTPVTVDAIQILKDRIEK